MEKITVNLGPTGNSTWYTQHFGVNGWQRKPMEIPKLQRCIGIFIFWKWTNNDFPVYSITAAHIPPHEISSIRHSSREFFSKIKRYESREQKPYFIIVGGGRTDTPKHKAFFNQSLRKFVAPFAHLYKDCQIIVMDHDDSIIMVDMILDEDGEIYRNTYSRKN